MGGLDVVEILNSFDGSALILVVVLHGDRGYLWAA